MTRRTIAVLIDRRRLAIGLAAKGAGAGLFALVLAGAAGPAAADSYCGAGRHVGAENDGAGMSWRCVPDSAGRSLPSGSYGGGGGSGAAAGLGAAAAGLEGLAALFSIASMLGSLISATDGAGPVATFSPDRAATRSRDLNRQAIAAMRDGRFDLASHLFNSAGLNAKAARNDDDYRANIRNAKIADAEHMLHQGYILEQKGDLAKASQFYMRGKQAAEGAGASDLAAKLAAYNDQLMARAGGAKGGVNATQTSCTTINGQFICR